jgi:hypothetical protein
MVAAEWDSNDRVLGMASSSEAKTFEFDRHVGLHVAVDTITRYAGRAKA